MRALYSPDYFPDNGWCTKVSDLVQDGLSKFSLELDGLTVFMHNWTWVFLFYSYSQEHKSSNYNVNDVTEWLELDAALVSKNDLDLDVFFLSKGQCILDIQLLSKKALNLDMWMMSKFYNKLDV